MYRSSLLNLFCWACGRDMVQKYGIKYFYDITDRSDFRANPDYKGVCHVALAQEGHCKPGQHFVIKALSPAVWNCHSNIQWRTPCTGRVAR